MNEQQLEAQRKYLVKLRKRKQDELNGLSARITAANAEIRRLNFQYALVVNDIDAINVKLEELL